MKKTKVIIPALGMLLLSTAASVTGTVAWFTANKTVTASGMQIKAKAEDGIVINNDIFGDVWTKETTAAHTGSDLELNPTSTADAVTWYHATSDNMDSHAANDEGYDVFEELDWDVSKSSQTTTTGGIGYIETTGNTTYDSVSESAYCLLNNFYVRSSGVELTDKEFYINKVVVTGSTNSPELDKSMRVLVKVNETDTFIVAPFEGATLTYGVNGATSGVTANYNVNGLYNHKTPVTTIPYNKATKDECIRVACYAYFEGEDANCKSANINANLDALSIEFAFGLKTLAA